MTDTPGAVFKRLLEERGLGKSDFARKLREQCKVDCAYHNVHRWTQNREFTPVNKRRAARTLNVDPDVFDCPDAAAERERRARAVLDKAIATSPVVADLTADQLEVLRSIRFVVDGIQPTVAFYESVSYALRGLIPVEEVRAVATENARLDAELAHKPPLRRR